MNYKLKTGFEGNAVVLNREFFELYYESGLRFTSMRSLFRFLRYAKIDTHGRIHIGGKNTLIQFAHIFGITIQALRNNVSSLVKLGIVIKIKTGLYKLNPDLIRIETRSEFPKYSSFYPHLHWKHLNTFKSNISNYKASESEKE